MSNTSSIGATIRVTRVTEVPVARPLRPAGASRGPASGSPRVGTAALRRRCQRRRRRTVALGLSAAFLALAPPLGLLGGGPLAASEQPAAARQVSGGPQSVYVVKQGDTLWSIAERVARGGDPRPIVDRLAGQVGGYELQPGQTIRIALSSR